jgi:TonB-dependent receptor
MPPTPIPRTRWLAGALLALVFVTAPSRAQQPDAGSVVGQVYDGETGKPIAGVAVSVLWPAPTDGSEPRRESRETTAKGEFEFPAIPAGTYEITFGKDGYRASRITDFAVRPGEANRADFPLPPLASRGAAPSPSDDIEEFVVTGSTVAMESLELRVDSDELLNVLSAEELSKFAATDVGEALKRVAGVNVVEGQFAIIRGLEDRYSSTLYNSAPVPSPDPDRQSVQLDLFPSEIVDNLLVSKTFAPPLPGNSAGGSINILTQDYPDEFGFSLAASGGFNQNAVDRFIRYESDSPVGDEDGSFTPIDGEFGGFLGGRTQLAEREIRYKALLNWERDYETWEGTQEEREPILAYLPGQVPAPPFTPCCHSGGLSLGELALSKGRFDLTRSIEREQRTAYAGLGFDADASGNHRIDTSLFYTKDHEESVQVKEDGYLPNFDYETLREREANGDEIDGRTAFLGYSTLGSWISRSVRNDRGDAPSRGPLWFTNFSESKSLDRERDLLISQANGDHFVERLPGLHLSWVGNYARTTQDETTLGTRYFFEPDDPFQVAPDGSPGSLSELGPGIFASRPDILLSSNAIDEKQGFGRADAEYERAVAEPVLLKLSSGGWYEWARRNVDSSFLESPSVSAQSCGPSPSCTGAGSQFAVLGDTPLEMGTSILGELNSLPDGRLSGQRDTTNESTREVWAWNVGSKATFWEHVDVLGGVRLENVFIESLNDPFTGENRFGAPDIFPTRYVFWDRLDNPTRSEVARPPGSGTVFNDQILGLSVPLNLNTTACDPPGERRGCVDLLDRASIDSFVNGEIDERHWLPSVGLAYRPLQGLDLRAAWSRTVARPSFRELGFYVSIDPDTDDLVVGNPQLGLSEVESWDARAEYVWGDFADLVAVSGFYKTIQDPIESIVVRNPLNLDVSPSALFRTFFNNPNEATLWGIEVEARKNLEFAGWDFGEFFTLGGNFTWIEAEVDRTEAELARSLPFFGTVPGDDERYSGLEQSRRLFGQPQWIANADVTFDQPDWGTRATLSVFAISDVLDAAGSANIGPDGRVLSYTIDRYIASYYQLDLVVSQTWKVEFLRGDLTFKVSAKNLTDSTRKIVYDPYQTDEQIPERSYKRGREFKFTLSYAF